MKVVLISMPDVAPIIIHEMAASQESKEMDFIIRGAGNIFIDWK